MKDIKRLFWLILGIIGIATLVSCNVTFEGYSTYDIYGNVTGKINGTEQQAIEGIVVALYKTGGSTKITLTDSKGWYEFRDLEKGTYTLTYNDIDGDKNGAFYQKELAIVLTGDFAEPITLTAKN